MLTRVEQITYMRDPEGFWLRVKLPNDHIAMTMNFIASMEPDKTYALELKQHRDRRSLDANSYCWVLIGKLSAALNQPKEQIYREMIRDIGDNFETVCVKSDALESLCNCWEKHGLGWITERFHSKIPGCSNVNLYYGSSEYDTKQMSRLIDAVIAECKSAGIQTETPEELARMKEEWK